VGDVGEWALPDEKQGIAKRIRKFVTLALGRFSAKLFS
jgi:hypothetical protein